MPDLERLQGKWVLVRAENHEQVFDYSEEENPVTLVINGAAWTETTPSENYGDFVTEATISVDESVTPHVVDVTFEGETWVAESGIYEFEGNLLKICRAKTRPTDYTREKGDGKTLQWFKKAD